MAKTYNFLFEVTPLNGTTPTTLRLTNLSADTKATTANSQSWLPCITSMPDVGLTLSADGLLDDLKIERGELSFFCSDDFTNHIWSSYVWNNAFYRAWYGEHGTDFASYTLFGEGRTTNLERDGNQVTVRLLGPEADVTSKLLSNSYAGIGGAEGPLGFKGNLKPRCFGSPLSVEPVELDPVNLVYQVHGYGAVAAIQPYEYGLPLEASQNKGNAASYAALIAMPLVPGEYATCLAEGMFRFGGTPTPKITADVTMPGGTSLADIANAILTAAGVPGAKIGSFAAVSSVQTNLYVTGQVEALEALQSLFRQAGCYLFADKNGVWQCGKFYASTKGTITLNSDRSTFPILLDWKEDPTKPPIKKVSYGFQRCWGVHSDSEASPIIDELAQKAEENAYWENIKGDGKPQDNATVGAPPGTNVGNKPVEDVIDAITDENGNLIPSKTLQEHIAEAQEIAEGLQQTYGTTVTAAASANAAAQHEQAALAAANNAQGAVNEAKDIRDDAEQKANNSEASRLASEAAKTASELARDQAQYHSGQAGGSAGAAAGHAGTAIGKADEASQSAAAALASSVTASSTAQSMMPATFGDIKNWSGDWVNALGALSDDSRFNAYDHGTYGRILDVYNAPHFSPHIVPKGRIALVRDKVYRITVKWALTSNQLGSPVNATIFAIGIKPNSSQTGDFFNNTAINCQIAENQIGWGSFWATHTLDVHTNTLIDAGCQWTRPLFRVDSQGHYAVQSFEIRDITGEYRASGSADAAASSASSAGIDSGKAGNSASAASGSATNAKTSEDAAWQHRQAAAGHENTTGQYRSDAETFRNQASNSATNASGSAATALEQAGVATGAANRAGDSASAASRSEGSAASKADEAGRSASAAQQAEVSATTAAQAMMPSDFQNIKNWTWNWGEANYDLSQDNRYNAHDEPSLGRILRVTNNPPFSPHIATKGRVSLIRDHKYRITVKWHLVGQQPNENPVGGWIFFIGIRPNSAQTSDYWNNVNSGVSIAVGQSGWGSGSWATHSIEVDANTLIDAGCQWTRPLFRIDSQGVYDVQSIEFRDITGEANAKGSADAASGSANTASIKANEAGQSANAAEISKTSAKSSEDAAWQHRQGAAGHENTAGQYRSDAETFRNQASNSASNASNSAATATQQSGVAASSALDAASRATGNIVSRGEWNATSGKGTWTDAVNVAWAGDIGQHVLSQTSRDSYDGEPVAGNWSNRRFRLSGEVQTWGSFNAQIGLHVVMNDGSNGWYIITVVNAGQWYTPFSTELLLPANVKAARGLLVSDGPHGDSRNGLNWRSVRIEDVTSEKAASDSASAAANSAQTATSKADEAGRSASAASSSEVRATSAAEGADKTFAATFPNYVGPIGKKAYEYSGDNLAGFSWENGPGQGWPQPYLTAQGPGQGGRYNRITFKESIPRTVGRRYRITGWFYNHGNNCANVNIWLLQTDNNAWDGNAIGHGGDAVAPECVNNVALNQGGFWKVGIEFIVKSNYKSLWKPIFEFQTTGAAPNGLWHMTGMTIEDITSEKAAADSATAASNAYSNAQIESGKAGQQAQAASGHANTAQIKSGEAQGYANAAQGSAATANDKASAAASSATLAATFSTGGGNLLPETAFAINTTGWNFYSPFNNSQFVFGRDQSGDDWRPTNEHNIGINQANGDTSVWSQFHSDQVSVEGSKWYEFSGYVAAHRCNAYIRVDWRDANDNGISSNYTNTNTSSASGGRNINNWLRCWGKVQAPSNATRAHVVFVKDPTYSGYGDSYAWMCRPMLRQTYEQANGPSPYAPGSNSLTASAQQASINQTTTAIATATDQLASLKTVVQAGSPNLLRNGGFNSGMRYWGETHPGWQPHISGGWGQVANRPGDWNGYYCYIESAKMPVFGGAAYTLAADSLYYLYSGSGHCYTEIVWFDGAGNNVGQHTGGLVGASHDYSVTGANRLAHKLTASSPGNATQAVVRLVHYKADNTSVNVIGWRQVKFEQGDVMTAYSNEASVTTLAESVTQLDGKTSAYWQVESVAGNGRAQLRVVADSNGGGGVDIIGDLRVTGNALIGGTVNPEALALDRFVKRVAGSGSGNPNAGQSLLLYAQDIGVTSPHGSYLIELNGSMNTTVGRNTTTVNGRPFYTNHNADGGLLVRLIKNGSTIHETMISGSELISQNNTGYKTVSLTRNIVVDSPGGADASSGNAAIHIFAIRGNYDTGMMNQGDYYQQDVSAFYSAFSMTAKVKWTFI